MRLWHYKLLPYLPDMQLKGQLRELIAIMHSWRDKGKTNHLLINAVMDYSKEELYDYFLQFSKHYRCRFGTEVSSSTKTEFFKFAFGDTERVIRCVSPDLYEGWHNNQYLDICMYNLLEKHNGVGKSRISDSDWTRLLEGYKKITGKDFEGLQDG